MPSGRTFGVMQPGPATHFGVSVEQARNMRAQMAELLAQIDQSCHRGNVGGIVSLLLAGGGLQHRSDLVVDGDVDGGPPVLEPRRRIGAFRQ